MRIVLHDHTRYGMSNEYRNNIEEICSQTLVPTSSKHEITNLYLMTERGTYFDVGRNQAREMNIFAGVIMGSLDTATAERINVGAMEIPVKRLHTTDRPPGVIDIRDGDEQLVAHYCTTRNSLYIPYNIADLNADKLIVFLVHAIVTFNYFMKDVFKSWTNTKNRLQMKERVEYFLKRGKIEMVEQTKTKIANTEYNIKRATRQMKEDYDALIRFKNELKQLETHADYGVQNFMDGLEAIEKHPQVTEILLDEHLITIHIKEVYANVDFYDGKSERRFYIGNMHVTINLENTEIYFGGDNPRKSYWSDEDPHPHVDGNTGEACLGNIAPTIAELCSQKEIYAIFLTLLDFLESANIEDSAGENIQSWDEVDANGKVINPGRTVSKFFCYYCEEDHSEHDTEAYTVYLEHDGEGGVRTSEVWCEGCREDNASWEEENQVYVVDHVQSEIEEYYENKEKEPALEGEIDF